MSSGSAFISAYFLILGPFFQVLGQNQASLGNRPWVGGFILILSLVWFGALRLTKASLLQAAVLGLSLTFFLMPLLRVPYRWHTWVAGAVVSLFVTVTIYRVQKFQRFSSFASWIAVILGVSFLLQVALNRKQFLPVVSASGPMEFNSSNHESFVPPVVHFILDTASSRSEAITSRLQELGPFTFYPRASTSYGQTMYSLRSLLERDEPRETVEDLRRKKSDYRQTYLKEMEGSYALVTNLSPLMTHLPQATEEFNLSRLGESSLSTSQRILADLVNYFVALKFVYLPTPPWTYFLNTVPYRSYLELQGLEALGAKLRRKDLSGKYFLIYLFAPHPPAFVNRECEFTFFSQSNSYEDDYSCALKSVGRFLESLKREGAFERSLVIIHGDHGRSNQHSDRQLPLLVVKYPGQSEFRTDQSPVILSDLGRTIMDEVLSARNVNWKGLGLRNPADVVKMATRSRYYFFNFKGDPALLFGMWAIQPDLSLTPLESPK